MLQVKERPVENVEGDGGASMADVAEITYSPTFPGVIGTKSSFCCVIVLYSFSFIFSASMSLTLTIAATNNSTARKKEDTREKAFRKSEGRQTGRVEVDTSMSRNCPCRNCLLHNFIGLYASVFNKGGMHPIPSTVEAASVMMSSTVSLDDSSLSDLYHSLPRPSPYHAEGSSHSGEEAELLRGDTEMRSEVLGVYEGGSKKAYSKDSPTNETSKMILEIELSYADSDDEDMFLTCLDDYTPDKSKDNLPSVLTISSLAVFIEVKHVMSVERRSCFKRTLECLRRLCTAQFHLPVDLNKQF
ncbi:hypothetical protein HID58_026250 [Brassica napus]|uniref:Uncharacterized protein n=1 Tax=Brassica napus TaxID=3708 RepID=A0ABQ8CNB6_BRANA|nr:hypothetical protein HID58_026250 [Brassica napus]